jgi:hypothetical protein
MMRTNSAKFTFAMKDVVSKKQYLSFNLLLWSAFLPRLCYFSSRVSAERKLFCFSPSKRHLRLSTTITKKSDTCSPSTYRMAHCCRLGTYFIFFCRSSFFSINSAADETRGVQTRLSRRRRISERPSHAQHTTSQVHTLPLANFHHDIQENIFS